MDFPAIASVVSAGAAVFMAVIAYKNAEQAKKSEKEAKKLATNTDEANKSAKKYYDAMLEYLMDSKATFINEIIEKKKRLILFCMSERTYAHICNEMKLTIEQVDELLDELKALDHYNVDYWLEAAFLNNGTHHIKVRGDKSKSIAFKGRETLLLPPTCDMDDVERYIVRGHLSLSNDKSRNKVRITANDNSRKF